MTPQGDCTECLLGSTVREVLMLLWLKEDPMMGRIDGGHSTSICLQVENSGKMKLLKVTAALPC